MSVSSLAARGYRGCVACSASGWLVFFASANSLVSRRTPVAQRASCFAIVAAAIGAAAALPIAMAQAPAPTEATTGTGEKILIYPDGRWEYADPAKRAANPPSAAPPVPTPAPGTATVAGACPPGSQGLFSLGRCIPPGDKDYNRGSLSGKGR